MEKNQDARLSQVKQIAALTAVPIILLVGPISGYFIGDWLDKKFLLFPWCTIGFLVLGFVAAGREIFRLVKQVSQEDKKKSV